MASFRDGKGREWKLLVNMGVAADVKRETGLNLVLLSKDTTWVDVVYGDPERFVRALWVMCEGQAAALDVAPEEFGYLFDGPTLEAAGEAIAHAVADFFPRSRIAAALRAGLAKILEASDRKAVAEIESIVSTVCDSATSAPASSESTPAG